MSRFTNDPLRDGAGTTGNVAALILADLSLQADMQAVLADVAAAAGSPDHLYLTPPAHLHVSLYSFTASPIDYDRQGYWDGIQAPALDLFRQWSATQRPFTLHFRCLQATSVAVIAIADPEEAVWSLRRTFAADLPPSPGGAPHYDLIHMTLARYARAQDLPADFGDRIGALPLNIDFCIREAVILSERLYPLRSFDVIETQTLSAPELEA